MELNKSKELEPDYIPVFSDYLLNAKIKMKSDDNTQIYTGIKKSTEEKVIFKLKHIKAYDSYNIKKEYYIYSKLKGIERIPKFYNAGQQGFYNILIIELLGNSLKRLLEFVGGNFSLATSLKICIQVLKIVKKIHKRGVVLRYLKPGNMVIGRGENRQYIYLIDFEIAKKYIKHGHHIHYKENKSIKGNRDFISIDTHTGIEISRKDDIESLGYNLIYFIKGELPWSHLYHNYDILNKKRETSLDELCEGLPEEIKEFIKYSRELKFEQEPDYKYLKYLLIKAGEKNGIDIDKVKYDWEVKIEEIKKEKEKQKKTEQERKEMEKENEEKNKDIKEDEKLIKQEEKIIKEDKVENMKENGKGERDEKMIEENEKNKSDKNEEDEKKEHRKIMKNKNEKFDKDKEDINYSKIDSSSNNFFKRMNRMASLFIILIIFYIFSTFKLDF